jgi:hypothetical protein
MSKQIERLQTDFRLPTSPMMANGQKFLLAMMRLQGHALNAMMRYQIEALSFLKRRYEQDMKLVDDLIATERLDDASVVCADFLQAAVAEYSTETGKVASIGSKIASDTARRVRREAETAIDDMAAKTVA